MDVKSLVEMEVLRQTDAGKKFVTADLAESDNVVNVLKRIIYPGIDSHVRFLLQGFPEHIEQANTFEQKCATIKAIVYTTAKGSSTVEVKGNDLSSKNIDTLFAKEFRLKTMNEWDANTFQEHLGNKVAWGLMTGRSYSGKKTLAAALSNIINAKVVSMTELQQELKKKMGTEEEPFEGEVPLKSVEQAILSMVA